MQESYKSKPRGGNLGRLSDFEIDLRLGKPAQRICRDCGEEFETINLGIATAAYCRKCGEEKLRGELEREEAARSEAIVRRMNELIRFANLPPKWQAVSFDNSDPKKQSGAFKFARKYAETFSSTSPSLMFFSLGNGTGKTHLAACIANYVLYEKRIPVRWEKARDVMLKLRRTFSDSSSQSEATVLNEISAAKLLVLDDVGRDPPSQWIHTTYWQIIDRRVEWGLPIIITTNLGLDIEGERITLTDRIGEGATSRLRELCQGHIIDLSGPDLR